MFENDDSGVHGDRSRANFTNSTNTFEASYPSAGEQVLVVDYQKSSAGVRPSYADSQNDSDQVAMYKENYSPNTGGNLRNNINYMQASPASNVFFLRQTNRGSSTPKRLLTLCPFLTPDRLNECFIPPGVFERNPPPMASVSESNTFSPCIEWQSTMNPEAFDTSNPAAYLPPERSGSAEQKNQRAIADFFEKNIIVPSPDGVDGGRMRCYLSFDTDKLKDVTLNSKRALYSACTPKWSSVRNASTQTRVTIPPSVDIDEVFAKFATFVETEVHESPMDTRRLSTSPSSSLDSICSVSRRKLFFEEHESPEFDQEGPFFGCSSDPEGHSKEDKKEADSAFEQNQKGSSDRSASHLQPSATSFNFNIGGMESSRITFNADGGPHEEVFPDNDEDELPREDFNVDLSPIKPVLSGTESSKQDSQASGSHFDESNDVSMVTSATPTKPTRRLFPLYDACNESMDVPDCSTRDSAVNDLTSMEMSIL